MLLKAINVFQSKFITMHSVKAKKMLCEGEGVK